MDKEEPNFNTWGEISDSELVLEAPKREQNTKNNKEKRRFAQLDGGRRRRELKINVTVQKKKKNRPQFSMVYTLIDYRNDTIKCSKLCIETTRQRFVVPLEFWTFYDAISLVYKSVDHGKLWSIC